MKELNWIQISDIHYNFENYNTMLMREKTIEYLKSLKTSFDFIVITGDVKYQSNTYTQDIAEFINCLSDELEIDKNNLFIVPGNHDVKRSKKRTTLIKGILASDNSVEEVNMIDEETYKDLLEGQNEFFEFYKKLTNRDYKMEDLHFIETRDEYNIINVNTCLISGINGEDEQKKLIIGQKKLREALKGIDQNAFNIAIGHHSIECLNLQERQRFENTLADCHIDMYLSGHVHQPNATFDTNNVNDIIFVSCGSGMCDDFSTVGVITCNLDMETGNGNIAFHKWSQKLEKWIKDNEALRIAYDNVMPIHIKKFENNKIQKKNFNLKENVESKINIDNINVNAIISKFLDENGINPYTINYSLKKINIDVPSIATNISERVDTVADVIQLLSEKTWIHISGDVWSGKTYLATLIANKYGNDKIWLSLKGCNSEQAYYNISNLLASLTGIEQKKYLEEFFINVCTAINKEVLIVIDDIPKVTAKLGDYFIKFVNECSKHCIKIITTGTDEIPLNIRRILDKKEIHNFKIPKFSKHEIVDLLKVYKAPEYIIENEKFVTFIEAKTKGYPSLVWALIYYISNKKWKLDDMVLTNIINEQYSLEFEGEIQDLVIETLNDSNGRELLYRLSEIDWPFDFEDVKLVCNIKPEIEFPMEQFNKLKNIWIREENKTFRVSPLIKKVAGKNISFNMRKSINLLMANIIMKRKSISPPEILRVIVHFIVAEEFDNAGFILIRALNEIDELNINTDEWGISNLWYDMNLPEKMSLDVKLHLRIVQIKYCIKINKNVSSLLEDFDILLKQSNENYFALFMSTIISLKYPQKANEYLLKSVNSLSDMKFPNGDVLELPNEVKLESLIWVTGASIKSNADIVSWINTIKKLSEKEFKNLFKDEIAIEACFNVINRMWMQEYEKEKQEQDWTTILSYFIELTNFARERAQEILWACSIRGRIMILADNLGDIDAAINLAEESLELASMNSIIQFIIKSTIGKQLLYHKRYNDALKWLLDAISYKNIHEFPIERIDTILGVSEALASIDIKESVRYAKMAVDNSKTDEAIPLCYKAKVLGEYIIALLQADKLKDAFEPYQEVVNILLSQKNDSEEWKEIQMIFGHVSGFIIALLTSGKPPEKIKDGGLYAPPERRMFVNNHPLLVGLYNADMDYVLPIHTCQFAKVLNKFKEEHEWAIRAYEMGLESSNKSILILSGTDLGGHLLKENRYKEALEIQLDCIVNLVKSKKNQFIKENSEAKIITYGEEILSDVKDEAEKRMIVDWAIPTLMNLSIINLSNQRLAQQYAYEIIDTCSAYELTTNCKEIWHTISNVFKDVFIDIKDYYCFVNESNESFNAQDLWLKVFRNIGAVVLSENPKDSIKLQLMIAPSIYNEYGLYPSIYRIQVSQYFKLYWIESLKEHESKYMGVTWKISGKLEKLDIYSDYTAIKKILNIISFNLGIEIGDKLIEWLDEI